MIEPMRKDAELVRQIHETDPGDGLALWWLGQSGFLVKQGGRHLLFDPYLSDSLTRKYANSDKPHVRMTANPVDPAALDFVDVITATHHHTDHLDADTLIPILSANPDARLIIPEANRDFVADRLGIDRDRPIGLVDGERKDAAGFTFHGIPAAHEDVRRDDNGRPVFMGFVAQRGAWSVYHSGDTMRFDGLAEALAPFGVDVALLPINGRRPERGVPGNLDGEQAAQLARDISAGLAIPCHIEMFTFNTEPTEPFECACDRLGQPHRVLRCAERLILPTGARSREGAP